MTERSPKVTFLGGMVDPLKPHVKEGP